MTRHSNWCPPPSSTAFTAAARRIVLIGLLVGLPAFSRAAPPEAKTASRADAPFPGWTHEAFRIGHAKAQIGWVADIPAIDAWLPVEQPDLADTLAAAPQLEIEQVGPPVRVIANTRGHVLVVPNRDGTTWDAIFHYYQSYGGEQEVFIVDLGTGEQKTRWFNSNREGGTPEMVSPFGAWYARGKLFWPGSNMVAWYDPDKNDIFFRKFDGPTFHGHVRHLGDDGNIYLFGAMMGMNAPPDKAFVPAVFNTETMEMVRHDPVGSHSRNVTIFYPRGCMDGDWLYSSIGNRPWRLQAYNFKTREYRLLATAPIIGDYRTIRFELVDGGGVKGYIREADFIDGIREFDNEEFEFWLKDGRIQARTGDVPPWSEAPAKKGPPVEQLFRWSNIQYWPKGWEPPSTPPHFDSEGKADTDGNVVRTYTYGGRGEPHEISLKVSSYPGPTAMLTEVNEEVIFSAANGYAEHTFFNVRTKQFMGAGASGISGYTSGVTGDLFSVCGYPNSITAYYDPARSLSDDEAAPNPVTVNAFRNHSDTHYPTAGIVAGADGRIYSAGHGAGRTRRGGGWSWYEPATEEVGGQMFDWNVLALAAAAEGRYVLLSGGGMLSCWDTATHTFLYQEKLEGLDHPGYIVEALPGLVVGFTARTVDDAQENVLYGCDPATGKRLWTKVVPADWKSPRLPLYGNPYFYRRGPDGFVWTYFDGVLVRIDPRTAEVIPVGILPKAAFVGFAGGEAYVAGQTGLHTIKERAVPVLK